MSSGNQKRKGIVLAGGSGTRLRPLTLGVSKQLLPIYDKPMIYYPIANLMKLGVQEILIVTTSEDLLAYQRLLGAGKEFGIELSYIIQPTPGGIAEAILIGRDFIEESPIAMALGDNIFAGREFDTKLEALNKIEAGAGMFGYPVADPKQFGVLEFDSLNRPISVHEKPIRPTSNIAVPGFYLFDNRVVEIADRIERSPRGELEITAVNAVYFAEGNATVSLLSDATHWFDTGTCESLLAASEFVKQYEEQHGKKIGCPTDIALENGWISNCCLRVMAKQYPNEYGKYLATNLEKCNESSNRFVCKGRCKK